MLRDVSYTIHRIDRTIWKILQRPVHLFAKLSFKEHSVTYFRQNLIFCLWAKKFRVPHIMRLQEISLHILPRPQHQPNFSMFCEVFLFSPASLRVYDQVWAEVCPICFIFPYINSDTFCSCAHCVSINIQPIAYGELWGLRQNVTGRHVSILPLCNIT